MTRVTAVPASDGLEPGAAAMSDGAGQAIRAGTRGEGLLTDDISRGLHQAAQLFQSNRLIEANALLEQLAPQCKDVPEFFRLRGHIAMRRRDAAAALTALQAAAKLAPKSPLHQFELAEHFRATGQPAEAVRHYRSAIALDPKSGAARIGLAALLAGTGQRRAAIEELDRAVAGADTILPTLMSAALGYRELKQEDAAVRCLQRACALRPGDRKLEAMLRELLTSHVRPWHFRMMNDGARNRAYDAAIRRNVGAETQVLEIGTGSGLLSMMAARAGAKLVTTCEQAAVIAETAAEIVRRNGLADRVKVIPKRSTQLAVGVDLPERADLLISEILSDKLLAENVLSSTAHARRHLLKPDGKIIPRAIAAVIRVVGGPFLQEAAFVDRVDGFDLSPFNRFVANSITINMESGTFDSFSDDIEVFRFDLTVDGHRPEDKRLQVPIKRSGTAAGLLQWLRLQLDDEGVFENGPSEQVTPSAWRQVFFPFPRPLELREGEQLELWAGHDLLTLAFAPLAERDTTRDG